MIKILIGLLILIPFTSFAQDLKCLASHHILIRYHDGSRERVNRIERPFEFNATEENNEQEINLEGIKFKVAVGLQYSYRVKPASSDWSEFVPSVMIYSFPEIDNTSSINGTYDNGTFVPVENEKITFFTHRFVKILNSIEVSRDYFWALTCKWKH